MDTSSSDPTVSENSDGKMSETQNAPTAEPESFESRPVSLANDDLQTGISSDFQTTYKGGQKA